MKKLSLVVAILLSLSYVSMAQGSKTTKDTKATTKDTKAKNDPKVPKGVKATKIGSFTVGNKLSTDEFNFLKFIGTASGAKLEKDGALWTLSGAKVDVKEKLREKDVQIINKAIKTYQDKNKKAVTKNTTSPGKSNEGCIYKNYYEFNNLYFWYCD